MKRIREGAEGFVWVYIENIVRKCTVIWSCDCHSFFFKHTSYLSVGLFVLVSLSKNSNWELSRFYSECQIIHAEKRQKSFSSFIKLFYKNIDEYEIIKRLLKTKKLFKDLCVENFFLLFFLDLIDIQKN